MWPQGDEDRDDDDDDDEMMMSMSNGHFQANAPTRLD